MTLYDSRRAPNPRRVRWFMAEKGIEDIAIVQLDILTGEHKTPEYLAKVGLPIIPALDLGDGTVLVESVAICRYLESLYPEPNMFGRDPKETAIIEMWTRRAEMMLATPLMMAVRFSHPALAAVEPPNPQLASDNRGFAEKAIALFDRQLADNTFLAGDRITIADILAFTGLDFARMVKFAPPPEHDHFARWAAAMRERPAAKAGT